MIKLFEAFSGYGSQALALREYGVEFESVGIAEIDKYAIAVHESLHGKVNNYGDVSKLEVVELPGMDLFTYSFPCQDISNAGKQRGLEKGSGTRSSLLWECERIIEGKRPKFLMMENVKNLVGKKNKPHFEEWLQTLEELGYNNYWKVINAKWCGVPQNRERVFCVSIKNDVDNGMFSFEEDFDNGIRLKDILEYEVDEKYYLSEEKTKGLIDIIKEKGYKNPQDAYTTDGRSYCIDGNYYKGTSKGDVGKCRRTQIIVKEATKKGYKEAYEGDSINLEQPKSTTRRGRVGHQIANTLTTSCNQVVVESCAIRGRYDENGYIQQTLEFNNTEVSNTITTVQKDSLVVEAKIKQIGNIVSTGNFNNPQRGRIYSADGISPSLNCCGGGGLEPKILYSFRIRKLTPKECFRLMGVSDEDITKIQSTIVNGKLISNSQQYKLAGNSIVVNCMEFLKNL